jgi:rare lipoprotein A (peptidoglycan hydrolase)
MSIALALVLAAMGMGMPAEPLVVPAAVVGGTATWYCGTRASCTRGYGPRDMVAAIDRKDAPWRKGDRVRVEHGGRAVVVTIVDVCACRGARVIDLSAGAFARLAPLGRGVISVALSGVGQLPRLPATDMVTLPS